jgi:hypothetical protein
MREAVAASLFGSLVSLKKGTKRKHLHKSKERKRIKDKYSSQQRLTSLRSQKFQYHHREQRPPGRILGSRGTRRKKLFDTFPLLVKARFLGMYRRR